MREAEGLEGIAHVEGAATPNRKAGAVSATDRRNLARIDRVTMQRSQFLRACRLGGCRSDVAQRMLASRSEQDAVTGTLLLDVMHDAASTALPRGSSSHPGAR